ncbi:MAG: hypothetical protein WCS65_16315, partial [Verrucomicrobiae bacterium]
MKLSKPSEQGRSARAGGRHILALGLVCFACGFGVFAASPVPADKPHPYPAWWFERDVIPRLSSTNSFPGWPSSYNPPGDYMAANQGQLKNLAARACEELDARLPGGAGTNLTALKQTLEASTNGNYNAVNLGQLKALAQPFYDRLIQAGYSSSYPWTPATADDASFSAANIGQAKNLFAFDLSAPAGQIPAWWARYYSGQPDMPRAEDTDGDGRTNLEEFHVLTDPLDYFNGASPEIQIVGGNNQGIPASGIPVAPLEVQVTDSQLQPLENAPVHFCFFQSLGQVFASAPTAADAGAPSKTIRTDASGRAKVWVRFSNPAELENLLVSTESSARAALVEFVFQRSLPVPAAGLQLWLKGGEGIATTSGKVTSWASLTSSGPATSAAANAPVPTVREGISAVDFDGTSQRMDLPLSGSGNFTLISAVIPDASRTAHPAATNYSSRSAGTSGQRYLFAGARGSGASPWPAALPATPANKRFSIWVYGYATRGGVYPQPTL